MDDITKRIVQLVDKECGGNRSDFARKIGITPAYAAQLYTGARIPSDRTIKDICREFGINENWLCTGVGDMKAEVTQKEKLSAFFADVLATAPDDRSAFISALADLPAEFWPLVAELIRNIAANLTEKEEG